MSERFRPDKCQSGREFSMIDALFTVFERAFAVEYIRRESLKFRRKITVLDVGCHKAQLMSFLLQNRIFVNYIGVDIRKDYLEASPVAKRKDVKLILADITKDIPIPDSSVDVAVSLEVFEHLTKEQKAKALDILSRKVRVGGALLVAAPINTNKKIFHSVEKERSLGHVDFPVKERFIELAESKGFVLEKYFPGYSLKSSFKITKNFKNDFYYKLKDRLGSQVARAFLLSVIDEDNGGGRFVFRKVERAK